MTKSARIRSMAMGGIAALAGMGVMLPGLGGMSMHDPQARAVVNHNNPMPAQTENKSPAAILSEKEQYAKNKRNRFRYHRNVSYQHAGNRAHRRWRERRWAGRNKS